MCMNVSVFCSSTFMIKHDSCQHTCAHTCRDHSQTLESCGGDECDTDSLSLLMQSYIQTYIQVCMCKHFSWLVFCFFSPLSIHDIWLSDSLFLIKTYVQVCICMYICFYFVSLSECTRLSVVWLSACFRFRFLDLSSNQLSVLPPGTFARLSSLKWVCVFLVWVCVRGVYMTYMTVVWLKWRLMHRTSVLFIKTLGHTDVHVQTDRQTQWMD
jgi:hypothetical protein